MCKTDDAGRSGAGGSHAVCRRPRMLAAFALVLAVLAALAALPADARADTGRGVTLDVIMILDCSGSMELNDPNMRMLSGAAMFMDMCDINGTRIAVVPFGSVLSSNVLPYQRIDTVQGRERLRSAILGNVYYGYTDTGMAFDMARRIYRNGSAEAPQNTPIVIFFSDGKTDVRDKLQNVVMEDTNASQALTNQVVDYFVREGVRIYVIGLKGRSDDNVDEAFLRSIAKRSGTNGGEPYIVTGGADRLPEIFNAIFADLFGALPRTVQSLDADGGLQQVTVNIPNNSVTEANIALRVTGAGQRSTQLQDIAIVNPRAEIVEPNQHTSIAGPQSGDVLLGLTDAYANIKLVRPMAGDWTIYFRGAAGDAIDVDLATSYDIELRLRTKPTVSGLRKNTELTLEGVFFGRETGMPQVDPLLYRDSYVTEVEALRNGEPIEDFVFATDDPQNPTAYRATLPLSQSGSYSFALSVDGAGITQQTPELTFEIINRVPAVRTDVEITPIQINFDPIFGGEQDPNGPDSILRPGDFFTDADGDTLTYQAQFVPETDSAWLTQTADEIRIYADAGYSGALHVYADDGEVLSNTPLIVPMQARSIRVTALWIAGLSLLGLLLIAGLVVFLIATRPRFVEDAYLRVSVRGDDGVVENLTQRFALEPYGGQTVTLFQIVKEMTPEVSDALFPFRDVLRLIRLKPRRNEDIQIISQVKNDKIEMVLMATGETMRSVRISGGAVRILYEDGMRYLELTYV